MSHRFFVPAPVETGQVTLTGSESHHLQHVLRAQVGDDVVLFDGSGREYSAKIAQLRRSGVDIVIAHSTEVDRESRVHTVVGVALPKGDRQRWMVEKLVEMGVGHLVPVTSERSVVSAKEATLTRLRRAVIEACKQCGRNRLMEIDRSMPMGQFLDLAPVESARWIADPTGISQPNCAKSRAQLEVYALVGPEGGFTETERDAAVRAGWQVVSLGPRILRIETAAFVMATLASTLNS